MTRLLAGRYLLLRELGRGGMGVVWRARDEHLGRDVAIKEATALAGHQTHTTLHRALREGRVCAQLNHPGIVGVHDIIDHDDRPWIVMELINGHSLAHQIEQDGPLPEHRAADLGLQLLDALNTVHRKGILHRDVKPANIMMDGDRAVLTDFGIALEPAGTALTESNQLIGSPEYLAPERIDGQPASTASDLWALGVTLYTAVHGTSPFARSDLPTTLAAVLAFDPSPPPRAYRLWPVIRGLLKKDPADRLTAEHAAKRLRSVRDAPSAASAGITRTVTVTAPAPATRPLRDRHTVGALAVLGVAVLAVWLVWNPNQSAPGSAPSASTTSSSSPAAPTSTTPSPPPGFMLYQDDQGFAIAMPADWDDDQYRPNNWYGVVVGTTTLLLDANRVLPDRPGTTAIAYLSDYEKTNSWQTGPYSNAEGIAYQRISLAERPASAGANTVAVLEYLLSYVNKNGSAVAVRQLMSAFVTDSGEIYTVELTVIEDPPAIPRTWQDVLPTVTTILSSFRIT